MTSSDVCELDIIYLPTDSLTPYENNARKHGRSDIEAIKNSIFEFGFLDPIAVYGDNNIIVEGHGRQLAAKELGIEAVPCIRLDHMTDEQRKAYTLAHNKTAELSSWDYPMLDKEIDQMKQSGFDMCQFGFGFGTIAHTAQDDASIGYAGKVIQYTPTGEHVDLSSCYDRGKYDALCDGIMKSGVTDEEKIFLCIAASRHIVFDYKKIAEYYCNSTPEMQRLMEKSALVIIDIGDAIENGYCVLRRELMDIAYGTE